MSGTRQDTRGDLGAERAAGVVGGVLGDVGFGGLGGGALRRTAGGVRRSAAIKSQMPDFFLGCSAIDRAVPRLSLVFRDNGDDPHEPRGGDSGQRARHLLRQTSRATIVLVRRPMDSTREH